MLNSDCCMTILLRQLWEQLLPRERTPWHWSKNVKFRPSWVITVPQRLCFCAQPSNCNRATCWHSELSILGLLHLSIRIHLSNKLWLFHEVSTKVCLSKPARITCGESKHVSSCIKFGLYNNFAPALGGAFAMGTNTMALIQAYSVQAHHDCSTKAVFRNLATSWHIELSMLCLLYLSIFINLRIFFTCCMKFFQLKITLGLALGESWPLLAQPQKNTDVHKRMLLWEIGENKDVNLNSWIKFRLLYNNAFTQKSLYPGKEHHGIDPNVLSSGPSWLSHKRCVSLHSCQTAIVPHVGTLNSAYWAFFTFQSAFI